MEKAMGVGAKIGWSFVAFVVGTLGQALLRELYGVTHYFYGGGLTASTIMWIWWHKAPSSTSDDKRSQLEGEATSTAAELPHTAQDDERSRSVARTNNGPVLSNAGALVILLLFFLFCGGVLLWQNGADEYLFGVNQTLRCEGAQEAAGTVNLVITTGWFITPRISLHGNNSVYSFNVIEASSASYVATDNFKPHPDSPKADSVAGTLNIDRLSGRLRWQWSDFQKGPPDNDLWCTIAGLAPEYCGSYKKGTHTRAEYTYICHAAAPKF